ncbi:MAG: methyltransferase [Rhabdochlamydiaceae bacterium]
MKSLKEDVGALNEEQVVSYFQLSPKKIIEEIKLRGSQRRMVKIRGIEMICLPGVYPSDQFRTTDFLLESISPFLYQSRVCDMGCGPGVVGLYSFYQGADKVVQSDINPLACSNAKENNHLHKIPDTKAEVFESDCFEYIPIQIFDLIVFNLPFHSNPVKFKDHLEKAFFDPDFISLKKFLKEAPLYCEKGVTKIVLAFSNKGDVKTLESLLNQSQFEWSLWKVINQEQKFDNRLYLLRLI